MSEGLKQLDHLKNNIRRFAFICYCTYKGTTKEEGYLEGIEVGQFKIQQILEICGFDCTLVKDPLDLQRELKHFLEKLPVDNIQVVFYFVGHGCSDGGDMKLQIGFSQKEDNNEIREPRVKESYSLNDVLKTFDKREKEIRESRARKLAVELNESKRISVSNKSEYMKGRDEIFNRLAEFENDSNSSFFPAFRSLSIKTDPTIPLLSSFAKFVRSKKDTNSNTLTDDQLEELYKQAQIFAEKETKVLESKQELYKTKRNISSYSDLDFKKLIILDCCRNELDPDAGFSGEYTGPRFIDHPDTAFLFGSAYGNSAFLTKGNVCPLLSLSFIQRLESDLKRLSDHKIKHITFSNSLDELNGRNLTEIGRVIQHDLADKFIGIKDSQRSKSMTEPSTLVGLTKEQQIEIGNILRSVLASKVSLLRGDIAMGNLILCDKARVNFEKYAEYQNI